LQSAGTTAVTIDTSQNVGIGTASPTSSSVLDVVSGGNTFPRVRSSIGSSAALFFQNSDTGTTTSDGMYVGITGAEEGVIWNNENTDLRIATNNTERMRIDSSGNLLVGTSSSNNGGGICVTKSVNGSTIANFENSFGSGAQVLRTTMVGGASNTSSYHIVCASGADRLYVYGNGNVVNSNNSYGTLSDVKLKENIVDASSKLADVMQLKVRNFNFKTEPDHKQIGFIAQELEQVFPALIDNTTSPNDPDDVIKSIKTSVLVPILVKAIQELKAINDTQAETINALTARIVALESK
jgi:hypothetical protein